MLPLLLILPATFNAPSLFVIRVLPFAFSIVPLTLIPFEPSFVKVTLPSPKFLTVPFAIIPPDGFSVLITICPFSVENEFAFVASVFTN